MTKKIAEQPIWYKAYEDVGAFREKLQTLGTHIDTAEDLNRKQNDLSIANLQTLVIHVGTRNRGILKGRQIPKRIFRYFWYKRFNHIVVSFKGYKEVSPGFINQMFYEVSSFGLDLDCLRTVYLKPKDRELYDSELAHFILLKADKATAYEDRRKSGVPLGVFRFHRWPNGKAEIELRAFAPMKSVQLEVLSRLGFYWNPYHRLWTRIVSSKKWQSVQNKYYTLKKYFNEPEWCWQFSLRAFTPQGVIDAEQKELQDVIMALQSGKKMLDLMKEEDEVQEEAPLTRGIRAKTSP